MPISSDTLDSWDDFGEEQEPFDPDEFHGDDDEWEEDNDDGYWDGEEI